MVKTQIQFQDHLYREATRIADEYEVSFAEIVRRGLEEAVKGYPDETTEELRIARGSCLISVLISGPTCSGH